MQNVFMVGVREREETPLTLRATRPHTVGYVGVCDCKRGGGGMSGEAFLREGKAAVPLDVRATR